MTRVLSAFLATIVAILLAVPAAAQPVDEDGVGLVELQRAATEELADIGRRLEEVQARKVSDDWVIVRAEDGEYVQVSLERVDELVPWVQFALADLDAAPALLRAVARRNPGKVAAADVATSDGAAGLLGSLFASEVLEAGPELEAYRRLKAGDIEGVDSDVIRKFIRDFFSTADAQVHKADRYAALEAQLIEQRETLEILLAILDAELDEGDASPSEEPSECTEADMWCDEGDGGIEYDALEGLVECDDDDVVCDDTSSDPATGPSLPPTEEEVLNVPTDDGGPVASADFFVGDWQTDIGVLRIEKVGGRLAGTLTSDAGVAQVDVVQADERYLSGEFFGPIDAPWTRGFAKAADECPTSRRGTTHWGILTMSPWGEDGFRGHWAPCDSEWRRKRHLYGEAWTNPIAGTRIVDDTALANDVVIDDWSGIWSTDRGQLELQVFRGYVVASFGEEASGGFKHAWAVLRQQDGDAGSLGGQWKGEYGTQACDERLEGVDFWGSMWLELDGPDGGFSGSFDLCGEQNGGSFDGRKIGEASS